MLLNYPWSLSGLTALLLCLGILEEKSADFEEDLAKHGKVS